MQATACYADSGVPKWEVTTWICDVVVAVTKFLALTGSFCVLFCHFKKNTHKNININLCPIVGTKIVRETNNVECMTGLMWTDRLNDSHFDVGDASNASQRLQVLHSAEHVTAYQSKKEFIPNVNCWCIHCLNLYLNNHKSVLHPHWSAILFQSAISVP